MSHYFINQVEYIRQINIFYRPVGSVFMNLKSQSRSVISIIVSEDKIPISILILISITYPVYSIFRINEFLHM